MLCMHRSLTLCRLVDVILPEDKVLAMAWPGWSGQHRQSGFQWNRDRALLSTESLARYRCSLTFFKTQFHK